MVKGGGGKKELHPQPGGSAHLSVQKAVGPVLRGSHRWEKPDLSKRRGDDRKNERSLLKRIFFERISNWT